MNLPTDVNSRFDDTWKNLYTFVPGLGQGDALEKVKQFLAEEIDRAKREERERIGSLGKLQSNLEVLESQKHEVMRRVEELLFGPSETKE